MVFIDYVPSDAGRRPAGPRIPGADGRLQPALPQSEESASGKGNSLPLV